MKRALAIAVALCTLGFAGFSQIALKGSWTATVCYQTPSITLSSELSLTYSVAGFDITSISSFGGTGLTGQAFTLKGAFGPFSISGKMLFDVTAVAYARSQLVTGFDFGGVAIGLTVNHWRDTYWNGPYFGYPAGTPDPCDPAIVGGNLQYVYTLGIAPWSVRVRYLDCSAGTYFQDLLVIVSPIELCCGIKLKGTFLFNKDGFQELSLTGINVPLCCGVSFDVGVKFTVDKKELTITPKFAGIAEACFTVWAAPTRTGQYIWEGIRVDGFRIRCTIGDCNYLEIVDVFNFDPATSAVPSAVRDLFNRTGGCREFEYIGLGFCGPGCCGGKYSVDLRVFFAEDGYGDGIFGISKFTGTVKIPIMTNFTLNLDFVMPAIAASPCASPSFCLGWTFTF